MKPPRTWVTTDWHLFHKRIVESCERFEGFEHFLIANHRSLVRPQDTLINLGDVIFYRMPMLKDILASIPCRHVLVVGNHDHKSRGWYERNGFHYAADAIVLGDVLFTHRPARERPEGVRLNVHGHLHRHREYEAKRDWHRLVAMENTRYCPVLLDQLINLPREIAS
jgi:calcineurin-like phosphoesterase family protein